MKLLFLAAPLLLFCACTDQKQTNNNTVARTPLKRDTAVGKSAVNPYEPIDISPVDVSYFPVDYPVTKMMHQTENLPLARVIYSRPHRQGRKIFGALLKYGEPWRLGANEATELELFAPATIQNKKIPKGRYILYIIPHQQKWTVVFNSNVYSWGLKQDPAQDVYRFDIPVSKVTKPLEYFTMMFESTPDGARLLMAWDEVIARLPIAF